MLIIRKTKVFAEIPKPGQITQAQKQQQDIAKGNREIMLEQSKVQRQQAQIQNQQQIMAMKTQNANNKAVLQKQKLEQEKKERQLRAQTEAIRMERENNSETAHLYKSKSVPTKPVPMK